MRIHLPVLATTVLLSTAGVSSASLVAYEGFDYPVAVNGVNGQTGGTGFGGAWDAPANGGDILGGSMSYTDGGGRALVTSGNRYFGDSTVAGSPATTGVTITNFRDFGASVDAVAAGGATTLYLSFLGQQTNGAGRGMNIAVFTNVANNGIYTNQERFGVGHGTNNPTAAGPFPWGAFVFGGGNNGALPQVVGSNYSTTPTSTASLLVLRIDVNASGLDERFRLYVNPSLDAEPAVATVDFLRDSLAALNEIDRIRPFAGNSNGTLDAAQSNLDEIRFGTGWADVTPFTVIPEPSTALLFLLGCIGLHRRRRPV